MTQIPKCPTCGRRPSERLSGRLIDCRQAGRSWVEVSQDNCADPIHDLADLGPAAVALLWKWSRGGISGKDFMDAVDALLASMPVKT